MATSSSAGTKTGTTTTTTTTSSGPQTYGGGMFGTGDLAQALLQTIQGGANALNTLGAQLTGQQQAATEGDTAANNMMREAVAQQFVSSVQKADIAYGQNQQLEAFQRLFSLNPDDQKNAIAEGLAKRNALEPQVDALEQQRLAAKAEYDAAASTDLISNPIGYLFAQLKLPTLAAKHNALASEKDAAQASIDQANANIQSRLSLLDATKKTVVANQSDAIRDNQLAQAKVDKLIADSKLEAAYAATSARDAGFTMQQIQLANMGVDNTRGGIMSLAQLKDMSEQRKLRQAQLDQISEERKLRLEQKKADADADARLDAQLAIVSRQKGLAEPMTVKRLKLMPKDSQEQWLYAALQGNMGENLGPALNFFFNGLNEAGVVSGGGNMVVDTAKKLRESVDFYRAQAEQEHLVKTGQKLPMKEAQKLGAERAQAEFESSTSSAKGPLDLASNVYDKTYNPYRAQVLAFADAVNSNPAYAPLKNNIVVKTITALNTNGTYRGADLPAEAQQTVLAAVRKSVMAGQLTDRQAAEEIAQFYQAAAAYNLDRNKYDTFGLGRQQQYLFSVDGSAGKVKTDLFNPVDIQRALLKQLLADRTHTMQGTMKARQELGSTIESFFKPAGE